MHLPAELLLHVATYLDTVDCLTLSRIFPMARTVFVDKMSKTFGAIAKIGGYCNFSAVCLGPLFIDHDWQEFGLQIVRYHTQTNYYEWDVLTRLQIRTVKVWRSVK